MTAQTNMYANTAIRLLWHGTQKGQREGLVQLVIDLATSLFNGKIVQMSSSGKRWPGVLTLEKFNNLVERRGVSDLESFSILEIENADDFCLRFSTSSLAPSNSLVLSCSSNWCQQFRSHDFIASVLRLIPATVGFETLIRFPLIRDSIGFFPIWPDVDPGFFGTIQVYFDLCRWWTLRNKDSWIHELPKNWMFRKLWMVYPCNIVSRLHLEDIGREGNTLKDWIESDPRRGILYQVTKHNSIWDIDMKNLESTVRELWTSGFFPGAEHFEIAGWSDRWQLPDLRARGSVLDLLDASLLKDTKFLDGEEPAQVTAYKRKVGKA